MSDYIVKLAQIKKDVGIIQDSIFFELHNLEKENAELKTKNEKLKQCVLDIFWLTDRNHVLNKLCDCEQLVGFICNSCQKSKCNFKYKSFVKDLEGESNNRPPKLNLKDSFALFMADFKASNKA